MVKTANININISDSTALITFITICITTTNAVIVNIHPMMDSNVDPNDFPVFMSIYFKWLEVSIVFHTEV